MSVATRKPAKRANTVTVDRDAMLALLSMTYRSCRQLRQIAAISVSDEYSFKRIDRSWLYETAIGLDRQGYTAMIEAAELIGVRDESELARFTHPDVVDEEAAAIVSAVLQGLTMSDPA